MTQEEAEKKIASFLGNIEKAIKSKYYRYIVQKQKVVCEILKKEIGTVEEPVYHINRYSLNDACEEIRKDVYFLIKRRDRLMNMLRPSPGKIAGIIAYRLGKNHIVNLCEGCVACKKQCISNLNFDFALRCAWEYINVQFLRVPNEIRKELFYTFLHRHVNQETLGLVFDSVASIYEKGKPV